MLGNMFRFFKKQKETEVTQTSETKQPLSNANLKSPSKPNSNSQKIYFQTYPKEYEYCRDFLGAIETFLELDYVTNRYYHYIALNKTNQTLIEIHTRVVGFIE